MYFTPEVLCRERRGGTLELLPERVARAQDVCGALPMVAHGVELSIGSAHGCNTAYLDMLEQFQACWAFLWHSEHLGFQTIGDDAHTLATGVPLPIAGNAGSGCNWSPNAAPPSGAASAFRSCSKMRRIICLTCHTIRKSATMSA